jgi:hypothetical protein
MDFWGERGRNLLRRFAYQPDSMGERKGLAPTPVMQEYAATIPRQLCVLRGAIDNAAGYFIPLSMLTSSACREAPTLLRSDFS